jgi:hypothetical protein
VPRIAHHLDMTSDSGTMWVESSEVRIGDRIARRSTCGGFVEWLPVTARHEAYSSVFDVADGGFYAAVPGERIEIASARS